MSRLLVLLRGHCRYRKADVRNYPDGSVPRFQLLSIYQILGLQTQCRCKRELKITIYDMSDKEAKLAAARKRAEALKAKKAEKKSQTTQESDELTLHDETVVASESSQAAAEVTPPTTIIDDAATETEDLQSLRDEIKDAENKFRAMEKRLRDQLEDAEASLNRRDEQVQALELEVSRASTEIETYKAAVTDLETKQNQFENEKSALEERHNDQLQVKSKALQEGLNNALDAKLKAEAELADVREKLIQAQKQIEELDVQMKQSVTTESTTEENELRSSNNVLQIENQSLLSQLTELRNHFISIQDEKLALAETVDRLQKQVKEGRSSRALYRSSRETSRPRASRDFDRTITSLQEVSLEEPSIKSRDPKEPPADLQSNIEIDLTSWYDRHAGEVIEV